MVDLFLFKLVFCHLQKKKNYHTTKKKFSLDKESQFQSYSTRSGTLLKKKSTSLNSEFYSLNEQIVLLGKEGW